LNIIKLLTVGWKNSKTETLVAAELFGKRTRTMKPLDTESSATPNLPRHPFAWLPITSQQLAFVFALLLTVVLMRVIHVTNAPLVNPTAPIGMISLQLAGSLPDALQILASWDQEARIYAALNLGIDYLYMVAYAFVIGLGCVLLARRLAPRSPLLALVGVGLSWGVFVALLLDATENIFLIRLLLGDWQALWPIMVRWCAIPKFGLVLAALAYLACGAVISLAQAIRPRS
jgi:hypothetical protein